MKNFHDRGGTLAFEAYPSTMWFGALFDKYHNVPPYYELDPEKPDEAFALRMLQIALLRNMRHMMDQYEAATRDFNLDGAIFFSNRTCLVCTRALSLRERLYRERTGKPTMCFQGEHVDHRSFSESTTMAKIDAFFETLERMKAKG
jgi:benzoyl-CoA reductase/2-hydroxyglutaryl-CoA dehydratase subunit BcrC/BadD/HgdB